MGDYYQTCDVLGLVLLSLEGSIKYFMLDGVTSSNRCRLILSTDASDLIHVLE